MFCPEAVKNYWCRIDQEGCANCHCTQFNQASIIDDELARTWELSSKDRRLFDLREGNFCANCRMSKRVRMLLWSLIRIAANLKNPRVLQLNQVNDLNLPSLRFESIVQTVFNPQCELGSVINGFSNQDMARLTFEDNRFDLAIHSETLEHLPDFRQALREVERVLKPGGYHVYSIPLLHHRSSRQRITRDGEGKDSHLLPLSTHGSEQEYPVFWEFGGDFIRQRKSKIYQIHYDNYWVNKTIFTIIEKKG